MDGPTLSVRRLPASMARAARGVHGPVDSILDKRILPQLAADLSPEREGGFPDRIGRTLSSSLGHRDHLERMETWPGYPELAIENARRHLQGGPCATAPRRHPRRSDSQTPGPLVSTSRGW